MGGTANLSSLVESARSIEGDAVSGTSDGPSTTVGESNVPEATGVAVQKQPQKRRVSLTTGAVIGIGLTALAAVVVVAAFVVVGSSSSTKLEGAVQSCGLESNPSAALGDDGHSISLDSKGEDDAKGLELEDVVCVLSEVRVTDSALELMDSTRALDGRQTAKWDDIAASWSYHPDNGLDLILVQG